MRKEQIKKVSKTCADCIHEFACQMWNIGNLHNTDATNCQNHETVKESAAYFIGKIDGKSEKMTNGDMIRQLKDEDLAEFIGKIESGDFSSLVYGKTFCNMCNGQHECDECRLWWLKQPADIKLR